jgi:hypothetical protein
MEPALDLNADPLTLVESVEIPRSHMISPSWYGLDESYTNPVFIVHVTQPTPEMLEPTVNTLLPMSDLDCVSRHVDTDKPSPLPVAVPCSMTPGPKPPSTPETSSWNM